MGGLNCQSHTDSEIYLITWGNYGADHRQNLGVTSSRPLPDSGNSGNFELPRTEIALQRDD